MSERIRRTPLLIATKGRSVDAEGDLLLQPGEKVALSYKHDTASSCRCFLRIVGEVGTGWQDRTEARQSVVWYRALEDALTRTVTHHDEVSLHLRGRGEWFDRCAHFKLNSYELRTAREPMEFAVWVTAKRLQIARGGQLAAALEIYHCRKGRHPDDVFDRPDRVVQLSVKSGTYDWKRLSTQLDRVDKIACVLVRVGGMGFSGDVFLSTPQLLAPGHGNIIPPYSPTCYPKGAGWLGENLSRKEWPEFRVKANGKQVFRNAVFCPITRDPDVLWPVPERVLHSGHNRIEITLEADYPTAPCYILRRAEILTEPARDYEIVSVPEYASAGDIAGVLIETNKPNVTLKSSGEQRQRFVKPGLHVMRFDVEGLAGGIELNDGKRKETIAVKRAVQKDRPPILLSSGDAVYIPQTTDDLLRFLKWYLAEGIGNSITFRPVYRWCGSRQLSPEAWQRMVALLNDLDMKYVLMADGRELPGKDACPDNSLLAGPGYLGRQSHENDGAFFYWFGGNDDEEFFADLMARRRVPDGIFPGVRPVYHKGKRYRFYAPEAMVDMPTAASTIEKNLRCIAKTCTRHTGPSYLFRYFYKAGFQRLGAETMYGPEAITLSALRGASRAYGKQDYSAHLAMQWGSIPHDDPAHARRYFLSLVSCFLHGVSEINTEEGLWRLEAQYAREDRFGDACTMHRNVHRRFRRFLETHNRRGSLRSPMAVLQGKNCLWIGYRYQGAVSNRDSALYFGPSEESFDLLKLFYPRTVVDFIYRYPCAPKPQGWYSGSPYGAVDILPIEAPLKVMRQYHSLTFLGWNTFTESQFAKLLKFVNQGGRLLLARPHVSRNRRRFEPTTIPDSPSLQALLGRTTKQGRRQRKVGKGQVIFYSQDAFPAEPAIRKQYLNDLRSLAEESVALERERGWVQGNRDVEFTIYDHGDMRIAYLLNIAWWQPQPVRAKLLLQNCAFSFDVPFGTVRTVTMTDHYAIMPMNDDVDIMRTETCSAGLCFESQADGPSEYIIFDSQKALDIKVTANGEPIRTRRMKPGVWRFGAKPGKIMATV